MDECLPEILVTNQTAVIGNRKERKSTVLMNAIIHPSIHFPYLLCDEIRVTVINVIISTIYFHSP